MRNVEDLLIIPKRLNDADIDYMITGAVASILYGEPRTTLDVDLVIALGAKQIKELLTAFPDDEFYCPPVEVIRIEINRDIHGHFNLIHHESGTKADCYPVGRDPLHHWAFPQRRKMVLAGIDIWVAPPEYVILRKLQFYIEGGSEKHLTDIMRIVEISGKLLDMDALVAKIDEYGLLREWRKITDKTP